jgi:predicted dehydrogenase
MKGVFRVGIIGCGRKASTIDDEAHLRWLTNYDVVPSSHTSAYLQNPRTKIVAVAARTEESLQRYIARWKLHDVRTYTDYRKMLELEELDIVSVVTHADMHAEITITAAKAGVKGIICEKAMATSLEEADEMISACESNGVKLLINHPRRYHPTFTTAKKMIEDGVIGALKSMRGAIWTFLLHNGTHLWDMFCYFAGDADRVWGYVAEEDVQDPGGCAMILFKNGVMAFADVMTMQGFNMQLYGSDGMIHIDMFKEGFRLEVYEDVIPSSADRPYYQFRPKRLVRCEHIEIEKPFTPPMQAAVQDLIDSIIEDRQPRSSGYDGRKALELGLAVHASAMKGGMAVTLPLADRTIRVVSR